LPATVTMKALLEAGVHFGHQTRRWNPRMRSFIFTKRNGIHIIDLQQTVERLAVACDFVRETVASGKKILFVGTKKQAQETIEVEAKRCSMLYVNNRWLGGTLTNFPTIQGRIDHLVRLEEARERGEFERLLKKEALKINEEIERLNRNFGGIKEMTHLPGAMFVVDPTLEHIAVAEANRTGVPIVAMVDTNGDPDEIDYPVPSNDDAIRAVKLITGRIADAALEGLTERQYAAEGEPAAVVGLDEQDFAAASDKPEPTPAEPARTEGAPQPAP
jgi:small subunit ribosomal protein S2